VSRWGAARSATVARSAAAVGTLAVIALGAVLAQQTAPDGPEPAGPHPRVVLHDSFDGEALDTTVWNTCHWWDDEGCTISTNDELEWYLPEQVSVSDGVLRLTAAADPVRASDGRSYPYRSGMVTTGMPHWQTEHAKVAFTYGRVEARVRAPMGRGLWPAVWLLPASGESRPEIDILEVLGHQPYRVLMHLHPTDRTKESPGQSHDLVGTTLADGWHTVTLDWSPGRLHWYVDDALLWQVTGSDVPDEPMYLVLNLAVGGEYPGPPGPETTFPATFEIDDVRITQR
jgi:beta-glucanase (GH16 family)